MSNQTHSLPMIATGASYGALPHDEHARIAVRAALKKMAPCTVGSVLLFLTSGYAINPHNAIKEAAKAAGTPQIFGCCSMGLLTEEEWLLDAEGAVAMVFPRELGLQAFNVARQNKLAPEWALTFSSPYAAAIAVNSIDEVQFGAVTSDEYGHGPYSIWQCGRIVEQEFAHTVLSPAVKYQIGKAEGVRRISPVMQINRGKKHILLELDQCPAVDNLMTHMPRNLHSVSLDQPFNIMAAVSENSDRASIDNGHYKLQHVISLDKKANEIHLSGSIKAGQHLFWAMRDEQRAQEVMLARLQQAREKFAGTPAFALMFPNISRGAEFYNGRDRDLELFQEIFPQVPMIGFYGHAEIMPGHRLAGLIHHYSTVFGIFGRK